MISDINSISIDSFKKLSINDFFEKLNFELYPSLYSELNLIDDLIEALKFEVDVNMCQSLLKKIYLEFDEMTRKEKHVLFPYVLKLTEENVKATSCSAFKNTKVHHTSILQACDECLVIIENFFINSSNASTIETLAFEVKKLKNVFYDLQFIKDNVFYNKVKSCSGCTKISI
jgi:hypothetical protein